MFSFKRYCPILFLAVVSVGVSGPVQATYRTQLFPVAHELFTPLSADPTELHFGVEGGAPVSHLPIARVDVGDYLGLYRVAFPAQRGALQLNVGGGMFNRFAFDSSHKLQSTDFYGNVPIDLKLGRFSSRLLFYHDSSHLGDDYLRANNLRGQDNSWEALRWLGAYQTSQLARLYMGYQHAVHTKPSWRGREALQAGFEYIQKPRENHRWEPYAALDLQSWERSGWTPTWTAQLGLQSISIESAGRGLAVFVKLMSGPRFEGQFYNQKETLWTLGLRFALSARPVALRTTP